MSENLLMYDSPDVDDPSDLIVESRFVAAKLNSALRTLRTKRLYASLVAFILICLGFALTWAYLVPARSQLSTAIWDLMPAFILLCAYAAFEAVRSALSVSAIAREIGSLREYQLWATHAAIDALAEDALKEANSK